MIRPIMKDPGFLSKKAAPATLLDAPVARDLLDTLAAHREDCVGMAANMIGTNKAVIVFDNGAAPTIMYNPTLEKALGPYETEEGCLSLPGKRRTRRYRTIIVRYRDLRWQEQTGTFTGWTAQIIQHELDHLQGKLI